MEGLHIQSEGTMRRIVIQSAEFSHSGVYCCDAIDDVIRFNVEVEGEWSVSYWRLSQRLTICIVIHFTHLFLIFFFFFFFLQIVSISLVFVLDGQYDGQSSHWS